MPSDNYANMDWLLDHLGGGGNPYIPDMDLLEYIQTTVYSDQKKSKP